MSRFVILRHELPGPERGGVHWDFMLEQGTVLRTWALALEPNSATQIAADALVDHRLAYLDYEGPISGDRGQVTQWDVGEYESLVDTPEEIVVQLRGQRLTGKATLRREASDQRWMFDFNT